MKLRDAMILVAVLALAAHCALAIPKPKNQGPIMAVGGICNPCGEVK